MDKILKRAFMNAAATTAYIVLIALLIFSFGRFFPQAEDTLIIPIAMLLLFVCSAAITGFLVFGKPVMLYIDGEKRKAISLLSHTIVMLFAITLLFFITLVIQFI